MCAGRGNNPAFATTAVAGGDVDELAEHAALDATDFAEAFTGRAALRLGVAAVVEKFLLAFGEREVVAAIAAYQGLIHGNFFLLFRD